MALGVADRHEVRGDEPPAALAGEPRRVATTGLIAETASGGCGFWYGFSIGPMPRRGSQALSMVMSQYLPGMR